MYKKLSCIFLLLFSIKGISQDTQNYSIQIHAIASINGMEMNVDIRRQDNSIKIVYHRLDSLNYEEMKKDKRIDKVSRRMNKTLKKSNREDIKRLWDEHFRLMRNHKSYFSDSLIFDSKNNINYSQLIDSVYLADVNVLKGGRPSNIIVLDGTYFSISITEKGKMIKEVGVHSPNNTYFPLSYRLISETLNLYRKENAESFLDKKYTNGY